ncbi:MAG: hypothetical protein KGJ58_03915 [Patescibacteria group bacterium]|nr:hypothetical protein [Patescibacteria group bacterium]MDE1988453.1 hypothetical protein [Patescibacteria group bacterium]MDE2218570.1 hypothetical protein [Patescibacteria group bacterium]
MKKNNYLIKNKLILSVILAVISLFVFGVQLMPYIYGGTPGHYHSPLERCGWPYGPCKI